MGDCSKSGQSALILPGCQAELGSWVATMPIGLNFPHTQVSAQHSPGLQLQLSVLIACRARKAEETGQQDFPVPVGGGGGVAGVSQAPLPLGGVLKLGRNHPLPLPRATPT